jgi:hypothetical protein
MFGFIQEQTSGIIFLFVLSIAAPIAAAVLLTTRMIVRRYPDIPFSVIVPAVLSTGLITSLLLGFVFQRAWESFDMASKSLNQEVVHLGQIASASSFLSDDHSAKVLEGVKIHIQHVLDTEWQQMATDRGPALTRAPGLSAVKAALMFTPRDEGERVGKQFIMSALSDAAAARSNRIRASHALIAAPLWLTIATLSVLLIIGIAFATSVRFATSALSVTLSTLSIACILTIIIGFDRPFSGGVTVSKEPMRELLVFLSRER